MVLRIAVNDQLFFERYLLKISQLGLRLQLNAAGARMVEKVIFPRSLHAWISIFK